MPYYDYRCQNCRQVFTVERSMNDTTYPQCESCNSPDVNRIWNSFVISGGTTPDVGQGLAHPGKSKKSSGCGSCSSGCCGNCH